MSFATATAMVPDDTGGFTGAIAEGWDIAGNANGGYLLALAVRALGQLTDRPDPVTVTAHYLAPGHAGPVQAAGEVVKAGRQFTTVSGALHGEGRRLLHTLVTFGDLEGRDGGPELVEAAPPSLPPPDDCQTVVPTSGFPPPFMGQVELRLHPEDDRFRSGEPSGRPLVRGWFRFPGDEPIDGLGLLLAVDAFPPTVFNARLPVAWTPTLELTAHVRARPAPGWLRCQFSTRFVTGGFLEEDGEVWDSTGRLVAQSRQLALVPRG
jgi:acyl-CoA thioesterase